MSGWSSCGGQSGVAGGAASLDAGACIFQEFTVVPQATYTASCDANVPGGYLSITLAISDSGFNRLAEELIEESNGANGGITATASAPDASAIGVITLYADEGGSFDNCVVSADASGVTAVTPDPIVPVDSADNLILNGDFSDGDTVWQSCGGQFSIAGSGAGSAIELSGGCVFQEFSVTAGMVYEASCLAESADFASVSLSYSDASFVQLAITEGAVTSLTQARVGASDTAPANSSRGFITLYGDDVATFDDCTVVEL